MIVIAKKVGRLANRLLLFAQFVGVAAEHGFRVANPAFLNYAHYFPATTHNWLCGYPPGPRLWTPYILRRVLLRATANATTFLHRQQQAGRDAGLIRLARTESLDLDSTQFLAAARRHRLLFVEDWFFRSPANCARHHAAICAYFTPHERHLASARALTALRADGRFVVGVHIRQGDYRRFKQGIYFYSHAQYRAVMEQTAAAFPGQRVSFLVCSDEALPPGAFDGLEVRLGNGAAIDDLYALAACDRIIGPLSTYNAWASYYGAVPRYVILDPARPVTAEDFVINHDLRS